MEEKIKADPEGFLQRLREAARQLGAGIPFYRLIDYALGLTPEAILAIAEVDKIQLPSPKQTALGMIKNTPWKGRT